MLIDPTPAYLTGLVNELRQQPRETEWLEFKTNNDQPEEIGKYISALANSAAIARQPCAYVLWGVSDDRHTVVGTTAAPATAKKGNEDLEGWLARLLSPRISFGFHECEVAGKRVVLLEISRAIGQPVQFQGVEYIRVGSYRKALKDYPEKARLLWRAFDQTPFEAGVAAEHLPAARVLALLDYSAYFELRKMAAPPTQVAQLEALEAEEFIRPSAAGEWNITNLGAILFARRLADFPTLRGKVLRIIQYDGPGRTATSREPKLEQGYANGFRPALQLLRAMLPGREEIDENGQRQDMEDYPPEAVRELLANALIHQDFASSGTSPRVEAFRGRVEISNPGVPLVDTQRFLDAVPKSRNETLAGKMRLLGLCEERGSGIDRVVEETERYHLPAPTFARVDNATRITLHGPRPLSRQTKQEKIEACYLHACLRHENQQETTNTSIRERFGLAAKDISIASRLIRDTVTSGLIELFDKDAPPKMRQYVPWYASRDRT